MDKATKELQAVEARRLKTDKEFELVAPRLDELREKKKQLEGELSQALVARLMGESDGRAQDIRKQIASVDQEMSDVVLLAEGISAYQRQIALEEQAIKLAVRDARLRELVPELEKLESRYLELRREIVKVSKDFNEKYKEASRSRASIPDLRRALSLPNPDDMSDYPTIPRLNWNDSSIGISLEQLKGERPW